MATEVVVKAAKEEASQAVMWYKAFMEFEDEVNEAVYDAFYKGFDECKKKVALAFHLLNLKDIIVDEPKAMEGGVDIVTQDQPTRAIEVTEPKANPDPPQETQPIKAIRTSG